MAVYKHLRDVCVTVLFIFFLIIPFSSPLYFNITSIGPQNQNIDIKTEGDTYISKLGLQVTTDERSAAQGGNIGHAIYFEALQLWDNASSKVTDFCTHFSFVIDSSNSNCHADGLAFFLAPVNSVLLNSSGGGGLGLAYYDAMANKTGDPFVAVEFDTYSNLWDPEGPHVGIDINSLIYATNMTWQNNFTEGNQNDAWISYNSTSKNFSVEFTGYMNNKKRKYRLDYLVDLRDYLPELVSFGFSAATGGCFEKNNVKSWEFSSSLEIVSNNPGPNQTDPFMVPSISPDPSLAVRPGGKKTKTVLVIGLTVGLSVVLMTSLVFVGHRIWRKKNRDGRNDASFDTTMDKDFETGCGPKKFSYGELVRATDNFADEKKLGEGGFGGVYLGVLRYSNSHVAVKRVSKDSQQGPKEYASEVKIISQLRHRNLVQLVGWCHEQRELLLIYEFMPNGSLDFHLFKEKTLLTWETRYKIAQGLASALLYLHEEWEQCVVHRDIKSSNIMLDSNFNAKLGDFGLARLVNHSKGSQTTVLAGTMGYMAPECVITGKASKESDVYSFGIVALEIACGRRSIDAKAQGNRIRLVEWVWDLFGTGKILEAVDPKLQTDYDEQEIQRLMIVGLWCAHPDNNLRPSIKEAISVLNFEAQLPLLPSKLPVPTYSAPPVDMFNYLAPQSTDVDSLQTSNYSYNSNTSTSEACHASPLCQKGS